MFLLKDAPIRKKLMLIIFLASGVAVLSSSVLMVASKLYTDGELSRRVLPDILIVIAITIISLIIVFLLLSKFQLMIVRPVADLANLMRSISKNRNYSLRASVRNKDEMGALAAGLNEMLAQIQRRDDILGRYSKYLEDEVTKRTEELSRVNEKLTAELAEREKTEEMLLQTQFVVDHASDSIFLVRSDGKIVYANKAACSAFGYPKEELLSMSVGDIDPYFSPERKDVFWETARKCGSVTFESFHRTKGGKVYPVEVRGNHLMFHGHEYLVNFACDITERKRAAEELSAEKERLAVTLQSIGDGVIATDIKGRITLTNAIAENLTGWTREEAMGRHLDDVFHIADEKTGKRIENPVETVLKTDKVAGFSDSTKLIARDGRELIIAYSGAPILSKSNETLGVVLAFRDNTGQRKMEGELLKMDKIESIGVLAGGIAHDFNNILAAILGNISMAKLYIQPEAGKIDRAREKLSNAERAVFRAKDLTQQLLTFSKGGSPIKRTVSIETMLRESVRFALAGSSVGCEFDLPGDLYTVDVDAGLMNQVINNLVINAEQAMTKGGIITIKAANVVLEEGPRSDNLPLEKGKYIKISFKDHGVGIPKKHLDKIFDPYFTTKQKGSGLGLATAYSIIKRHGGHITVDSAPGKGSIFSVYLKASKKGVTVHKEEGDNLVYGQGRILIMDDEEIVVHASGEILKALGYDVEPAKDGEEALELYERAQETGKPFDIVILDLTVPGGMGGKETIKRLLELDPGVKAIVSSGYSNDPIMSEFRKYGFSGVVPKPYELQELSKVIGNVMGS